MNKNFFENLAIEAGTCDVELMRKAYYGLIRSTIKDLRNEKDVAFPEFGLFYIKRQKAKRMKDVRSGEMINIEPVNTVKFKPNQRLKKYVRL